MAADAVVRFGCVVAVDELSVRESTLLWRQEDLVHGSQETWVARRNEEH